MPYQKARRDRKGLGGPSGGWEALRTTGRVREDLPKGQTGREAHLEGWEGSRDPPGGLVGVGRSYLRAGRIREIHPKGREGSAGPPGELGLGREALPVGQVVSGASPRGT